MISSPQAKPLQAKAKIEITADEIRAALIANQRDFSQAVLRSKSPTEQAAAGWHGAEEVISVSSDLSREQVEGVLRAMVASRAHLRENVAILPVIHLTEIVAQARDVAYRKIIAHEAYQADLPSKEPLKEPKDCKDKEELALRNAEEKHRAQQEIELGRNEAVRVLADNNFVLSKLVLCFLEAMATEPNNFLGNPHKKDIPFTEYQQFIIPMRTGTNYIDYSDTHYDVVVVNCNRDTMTADITFYDSLGWSIGKLYDVAIQDFFKQKGFQVTFNSVAKKDQNDGYNCGVFATLRAIEIASQNRGVEESLIQKFHQGNYKETSNHMRLLFGYSLKELGFNVKVDETLEKSMSHSQRGASVLSNFAKFLDNLSNQIQQISGLPVPPAQNPTPLAELDVNFIFRKCDELRLQMQTILKQKLKIEEKTPQDEEAIQFLFSTVLALNIAIEEYKTKMKVLSLHQENGLIDTALSFLSYVYEKFSALSPTKKIVFGGLALGATILGSAYSLALFLKLASFLPSNPLLLIGMGALGFVGVLETSKAFKASHKAESEANIDSAAAAATTATLLEVNKSIELDKAAAQVCPVAPGSTQDAAPVIATDAPAPAPANVEPPAPAAPEASPSEPANVPAEEAHALAPAPTSADASSSEPASASVEETPAAPLTPSYQSITSRRRRPAENGSDQESKEEKSRKRGAKRKMDPLV